MGQSDESLKRLEKIEDEQTIEFLECLSEMFSAMPIVQKPKIMRAVTKDLPEEELNAQDY